MEDQTNDPGSEADEQPLFGAELGATSVSARNLIAEAVSGLIYDDGDPEAQNEVENASDHFPPNIPPAAEGHDSDAKLPKP